MPRSRGLTLVELLVAAAIGAMLLGGLTSVARQAVLARAQTRDGSEAVYQARFALQRVAAAATATAPRALLPPAANTSGDWFSPVAFCVNGGAALVETTTADTGCTGTQVIAERVSSFSATVPAGAGALEAVSAVVAVTLTGPGGGGAVTLSERLRLGGGVK
jgi:prepilin-type N-terminal cleavage/methylation domain-containing protein